MVDLLLHVDASIVFISLVLLHGLGGLVELLLNLIENLLQLVKVLTPPRLQLGMIPF